NGAAPEPGVDGSGAASGQPSSVGARRLVVGLSRACDELVLTVLGGLGGDALLGARFVDGRSRLWCGLRRGVRGGLWHRPGRLRTAVRDLAPTLRAPQATDTLGARNVFSLDCLRAVDYEINGCAPSSSFGRSLRSPPQVALRIRQMSDIRIGARPWAPQTLGQQTTSQARQSAAGLRPAALRKLSLTRRYSISCSASTVGSKIPGRSKARS